MRRRRKNQEGLKTLLTHIIEKALKATEGVISFETALHELPSVDLVVAQGRIGEDEAEGASHLREALFDALRIGHLTADEVWQAIKEAGLERVIRLRDLNETLAEIRDYHRQLGARRITFAAAIQNWMDEREPREV